MLKFFGKEGEYIAGIPARDLTAEEWEQLPKERQEFALKSGLYKLIKDKAAKAEE